MRVANLARVKREEIVRSDFPPSRKGYDREAVDAHLERLAERIAELERGRGSATPSVAGRAGDKVSEIVAFAEAKAAEIEGEARQRAEAIISEARTEARNQIERAQGAVAGLVKQADDLRERVGALGRDLGGETEPATVPEPTVPQPEVDPSPVVVPEPEPPREPVPAPDPMPAPEIEPVEPEQPPPAAGESGNGDEAGARLVAMKMALDGSSREEVEQHLSEAFGLTDAGDLLDDVFARAKR
jgi:DivIVA domain-containing protein